MMTYYVYILASRRNGTLYVGVTNNIFRRVHDHKKGLISSFTKQYDVKRLVYAEQHDDVKVAIQREKRIKAWRRKWKLRLIEEKNPGWRDLSDNFEI